jgi:O-antigen/teichoic acid export membrane protein
MNIGKKDVVWNYIATFLQIGSSLVLLPFMLHSFSGETVGLWTVYATIISFVGLLDLGFNATFSRNITYIVSGVKELKINGYQSVNEKIDDIDYGLFKGLIQAMKWFYTRMSVLLLLLLSTAGTYYILTLLKTYSGDHNEVYVSWSILCGVNAFSLYTLYYDALLSGRGLIKQAKQIQIAGQTVYLVVAIVLIYLHFNLTAIVSAQALSIIIRRYLSRYVIFTPGFKQALSTAQAASRKEFIRVTMPNAMKLGLTCLGSMLTSRVSVIVGALYLALNDIASYGITVQIIFVMASLASVYSSTYMPKIAQFHVQEDKESVKIIYLKSCWIMLFTYVIGGSLLIIFGGPILQLIKSNTLLLPVFHIIVLLLINLLATNHSIAGQIIMQQNKIPFFKADIITGGVTLILLFLFLQLTDMKIWGMILAPGIACACYSNWKWPWVIIKEYNVRFKDIVYLLLIKKSIQK